ncbi:hypothetical protein PRBRB14_15280 [Hallella multisaccharivorax DSM 17128]|uniref:Esterase n=1 Tax=Hallella multisaccharivorax DSM 17128 TaxID=688246 RepID=F8NCA2_9BACT|nr:hypothetical protein Premu_2721 [Hallella multisaccharivorax DSM 17128]GJG30649.1 hypothetical protein PRBRB14_15280 [Hallella multisaccharivorax DSM 17128]
MNRILGYILIGLNLTLLFTCSEGIHQSSERVEDGSTYASRVNIDQKMYSNLLKMEVSYDIILPEDYSVDISKSYDIVYLLHGYSDNKRVWRTDINILTIYDNLVHKGVICPI